MIPAHARPAHRRLRQKLAEIAAWNESCEWNREIEGDRSLGIITSGVTYTYVREAAPQAAVLKLALTYPLPLERIRRFAESVERCLIVEEGDPYLFEQLRAAGLAVEQKPEMFRFGELDVARVRRILAGDTSPEPVLPPGKPPALCPSCPHRVSFETLRKLDCIVAGDIGCYTLGALPPFEAMDSQLCMGASIGMGLGLRHVLPEAEARRVVSVIGDSTFVHSGITGLVEMVYNPPPTGHVLLILDNGTTAMTGLQEHPGTGRTLGHEPTGRVVLEDLARSLGVPNVAVIDPVAERERFEQVLRDALGRNELSVIVARRPCLLAAGKIKQREKEKSARRRKAESGKRDRDTEGGALQCPVGRVSSNRTTRDRGTCVPTRSVGTRTLSPSPLPSAAEHRHCRAGRARRAEGFGHSGRRRFPGRLRREEVGGARDEPAGRLGGQRRPLRPGGLQPDGAAGRGRPAAGPGRGSGGEQPAAAPRGGRARSRPRRSTRPRSPTAARPTWPCWAC